MTETPKKPKTAVKKVSKVPKAGKSTKKLSTRKGRPVSDGPAPSVGGAPRKPKKVEMNIVRGYDLAVVEELVKSRSAEGFLPKQIVQGHYHGDAGWLLIFE